MTREEFYSIICGDKVFDISLKLTGTVKVASRGEIYIEFLNKPGYLYCYDIDEDPDCYKSLELL